MRTTALVVCLWLSVAARQSRGATPADPLRLGGTFLQYQEEMRTWSPSTWSAVLDRMRDLRMNIIIVQMLVRENDDGTTHSFIGASGQTDATEVILNYADANGLKVFLGTYCPSWKHDMLAGSFLSETQGKMAVVAKQAWDRYLSDGRHPSFAGWYIPYEPWTADYQPAEIARLRLFLQQIHAACLQISGDMPLAISPFISAQRPPPCQVEQTYRQILDQSGPDLLLLQDSVGAQKWETDIRPHVAPYFHAFRAACDATGVRLWANIESFRITAASFFPADAARLSRQLGAAAPFVDQFVTFDYFHYMNPVGFLSSWDANRRSQMQRLYADYKAAFVTDDYAPWAPPRVTPGLLENSLTLRWTGSPADQYEVQINTNLTANWTALSAPILTHTAEFQACDTIPPGATARFYRVRRLSRLEVPDSMVWVPPGTFAMGTPPGDTNRTPDELSPFEVTLTRGFWMGRFEVTQSEYQNVMCTNPASFVGNLESPVEMISWTQACDYCTRLTQQERQAGRLPADYSYRLPTEAEWEYAARAGTTNRFSFGRDPALLDSYGWYQHNSGSHVHPVGMLQPNPWGLRDVHGNVFEWCWDWIRTAPSTPMTDLVGSTNTIYRTVRGGAWSFPWGHCRSSWRAGQNLNNRQADIGLRVVLVPAP
jgi:formylglycine-generating enzyme required for sulfatase activity